MSRRTERINDLLRSEISDLIRREVKDPRVEGLVSITEVFVSPDLRIAKVFVSVMGTEDQKKSTLTALGAASPFLQRELGKRLTLRRTPELTFLGDEAMEEGSRIMSLLDQVLEEDSKTR